jgi:S-methylmethionine-dependent homocysteine/selenocysteine methylase
MNISLFFFFLEKIFSKMSSLQSTIVLGDAGIETWLVYVQKHALKEFASFPLLATSSGRSALSLWHDSLLAVARKHRCSALIDLPTWRLSADWLAKIDGNDSASDLSRWCSLAVEHGRESLQRNSDVEAHLNAVVGPRGDGYCVQSKMSIAEARLYHFPGVRSMLARSGGDESSGDVAQLTALTMTYSEEAAGIVLASARDCKFSAVCVMFTVEVDGHLPSGETLGAAIEAVDTATDSAPLYYGVNCAHPSHVVAAFADTSDESSWAHRIGALRPNASKKSHAELDACAALDDGDAAELAEQTASLAKRLPNLRLVGGCCGTDAKHLNALIGRFIIVDDDVTNK